MNILTNRYFFGLNNFFKKIASFSVSFCLVLQSIFQTEAFANPSNIIPDGTTKTTTEISSNNITVVNIATPTASGTSINNFDQFNVDRAGAIINNSSNNIYTNLGGNINGNSNLLEGEAKVIVGEVTGNMPSNLAGYTEIAGKKAEFILLNPNGITCSGCGFINANSLTLGTGSAVYNSDGSLSSAKMGNGNVLISETGLDATVVDYFRIFSKNIKISAPVLANELEINQGSGDFNTSTNKFSGIANSNLDQIFGIDISNFGSIYAGKATLIANDAGLGVNIASDVTTSKDGITITSGGDVVYNNLRSSGSVNISSNNGSIKSTGEVTAYGDVNLIAQKDITLPSFASSEGDLNIIAGGNITNDTQRSLLSGNNINIQSKGEVSLNNSEFTGANILNIASENLNSNNSMFFGSDILINVTKSANFDNSSIIFAHDKANIVARTLSLNNNSHFISGNLMNVFSNEIVVNQSFFDFDNANITSSGDISFSDSQINGSSLAIYAKNNINNSNTTLLTSGDIEIVSNSLSNTNGSKISTLQNLSISSNSILNNKSEIVQYFDGYNLNILTNSLENSSAAFIISGGNLNIEASVLNNSSSSQIFATNAIINLDNLNNKEYSTIRTFDKFVLNVSDSLAQDSSIIQSFGDLKINAKSILNQNSQIYSVGELNITTEKFINDNQTYLFGDLYEKMTELFGESSYVGSSLVFNLKLSEVDIDRTLFLYNLNLLLGFLNVGNAENQNFALTEKNKLELDVTE